MPLPLTVSCFSKIQIGLPFWYRLTWVVPEKWPLNGCVCVCVCLILTRFLKFGMVLGMYLRGFFTMQHYICYVRVTSVRVRALLLSKLLLLPHQFNGLFSRTTWVSRYQKGETSLGLNEVRDDGVSGCSGISWTICNQSAPRCRQIITPTHTHTHTHV